MEATAKTPKKKTAWYKNWIFWTITIIVVLFILVLIKVAIEKKHINIMVDYILTSTEASAVSIRNELATKASAEGKELKELARAKAIEMLKAAGKLWFIKK